MIRKHVYTFKKLYPALFALVLFLLVQTAVAQQPTITFTLLKAPCNNDGILQAHITGATLPITITWWYDGGGKTATCTTGYDTIFNFGGRSAAIYSADMTTYYGDYYGEPAINYYVLDTADEVCPALGHAEIKITSTAGPYTVEWVDKNGVVVDTGLRGDFHAGSYAIHITDGNGCTGGSYSYGTGSYDYGSVSVSYRSSINATVTSTPANCTNGTATVTSVTGGKAPYTYLWANGANTPGITNMQGGYYYVTITDSIGCYGTPYAYIQQAITITLHTTPTPATCLQNNGSAIAFGSGGATPYTYVWNDGQQTQTATGLVKNYYYVTASDANHCTGTGYANITASTPITVKYTATPSLCTAPTGSAKVTPTGGTPPYTIKWSTFPQQTGATAAGLAPGSYTFVVTDAVGCVQTGAAYVPPISVISAHASSTSAYCTQATGSASISVSGSNPPFTYVWGTGATTAHISNLSQGYYGVVVTDAMSCQVTKNISVNTYSPVHLTLSPVQASCLYAADGSITAHASGGTPPYNYGWGGQTSAAITGLTTGCYSVYVTDAAGCNANAQTTVPYNSANNSCYCTLTGRVYVDANTNCTYDVGEQGVANVMIHCAGLGYTFTNANGVYTFRAPSGTYTLSEQVLAFYPLAPCQTNNISITVNAASNCTVTNNFANSVDPIHDLQISTIGLNCYPVVGTEHTQRVVVKNNGTITESTVQMGYRNDGQLQFSGAPAILTQQNAGSDPNWYGVTTGFPVLAPGGTYTMDIKYQVPTNIPLNTAVVFNDTATNDAPIITNWLTDYSPWDNVNAYTTHVVGSFDPNNKEVAPLGAGNEGYINTTDSILTYTIHFQNTGNYPASKVVVIDTLDSDLDIATLKPVYGSHAYSTDMSESGVIKFTFDNINLPDSLQYPKASIGVVQYQVRQKPHLAGGTRISSPASIYFDYNAPVRTNVAVNTINIATEVEEPALQPFRFNLYPNPSNGIVHLAIHSEENTKATLSFYNMLGEVMQAQILQMEVGENSVQANTNSLLPGLYFAVITDGHYSYTRKVTVLE